MEFSQKLSVDRDKVIKKGGYRTEAPPASEMDNAQKAIDAVESVVVPRWVFRRYALREGPVLDGVMVALPGRNIQKHLAGCHSCMVMALTLGQGVEQALRSAEAVDISKAFWMDTAASVLAEQYAAFAEQCLRESLTEHEYMTIRYSPGYGDLPITLQKEIVRILDGARAIGLTVSDSGIMIPRKSVTALMGIADHPVKGSLADCSNCTQKEKCRQMKGNSGYVQCSI